MAVTQQIQVFIRSEELANTNPTVIASYPSTRPVDPTTHGQGMSVYVLDVEALKHPGPDTIPGAMTLVDNWQQYISTTAVSAEATRRIQNTFSMQEQLESLHLTVVSIEQYGTDPTKWPVETRQRKAQYDEKWKYVDAVLKQAQAHRAVIPHDLSSDKSWPRPPENK